MVSIGRGLMKEGITVYSDSTSASPSLYGNKTYSTNGSTFACRYVEEIGAMRMNEDESIPYTGIAWVDSTGNITMSDKVTIPSGESHLPIVALKSYPDELGNTDHQKLFLGK